MLWFDALARSGNDANEKVETTVMLMGEVRAEGLLRAIDPVVRDGLSTEQEAAIRNAARQDIWVEHPVDIRLSLPSPFGRLYLALVAGRERRSGARLAVECARHPLNRLANLIAIAGIGATVALAGLAIFLLASGVRIP